MAPRCWPLPKSSTNRLTGFLGLAAILLDHLCAVSCENRFLKTYLIKLLGQWREEEEIHTLVQEVAFFPSSVHASRASLFSPSPVRGEGGRRESTHIPDKKVVCLTSVLSRIFIMSGRCVGLHALITKLFCIARVRRCPFLKDISVSERLG